MILGVVAFAVVLMSVGCQGRAEALFDAAKRSYQHAPALAPLPPLPSDEHRARWDILLLVGLLSLEWCMGCALPPPPPPPAACLQRTCLAESAHGR